MQELFGKFVDNKLVTDSGHTYPIPRNYISKSRLVEGDRLKLIINNGEYIYKQIEPVARKRLTGIVHHDGNQFYVEVENKKYRILDASVTYYKLLENDTAIILVPADNLNSAWAAMDDVIRESDNLDKEL